MKDQVDLLSARFARLQAEAAGTEYVPEPSNPHAAIAGIDLRSAISRVSIVAAEL